MEESKRPRFEPLWEYQPEGHASIPDPRGRSDNVKIPAEVLKLGTTTYLPSRTSEYNYISSFHLFPNLPVELRRMIWQQALPGPRVVEIIYDDTESSANCFTCTPFPTILHVSAEARKVALESYKLSFGSEKFAAKIYFNFNIDTFYAGVGNFSDLCWPVVDLMNTIDAQERSRIQYFAIDDQIAHDDDFPLVAYAQNFRTTTIVVTSYYGITETINTPCDSKFGTDIVLSEVKNNPGEMQAWEISKSEGELNVVSRKPPQGISNWPVTITRIWEELEVGMRDYHETCRHRPNTVRWVRHHQLERDEKWHNRLRFLDRHTALDKCCCVYSRDSILSQIMWLNDIFWFSDEYNYLDMLEDTIENVWEPVEGQSPPFSEEVYMFQNKCVCRVPHKSCFFYQGKGDLNKIPLNRIVTEIMDDIKSRR